MPAQQREHRRFALEHDGAGLCPYSALHPAQHLEAALPLKHHPRKARLVSRGHGHDDHGGGAHDSVLLRVLRLRARYRRPGPSLLRQYP